MEENDPRREATLLRLLASSEDTGEENVVIRPVLRPPKRARCEVCGNGQLSSVPHFSTGSGIAYRTFADDVICQHCGHIGPFVIE